MTDLTIKRILKKFDKALPNPRDMKGYVVCKRRDAKQFLAKYLKAYAEQEGKKEIMHIVVTLAKDRKELIERIKKEMEEALK
jgi:hypothetical protein